MYVHVHTVKIERKLKILGSSRIQYNALMCTYCAGEYWTYKIKQIWQGSKVPVHEAVQDVKMPYSSPLDKRDGLRSNSGGALANSGARGKQEDIK